MVEIFWSPLSVTPMSSSCFAAVCLLVSTSTLSEVAVLLILSFVPPLIFSFETKSLVVHPMPFCFSPNPDLLPLTRCLN